MKTLIFLTRFLLLTSLPFCAAISRAQVTYYGQSDVQNGFLRFMADDFGRDVFITTFYETRIKQNGSESLAAIRAAGISRDGSIYGATLGGLPAYLDSSNIQHSVSAFSPLDAMEGPFSIASNELLKEDSYLRTLSNYMPGSSPSPFLNAKGEVITQVVFPNIGAGTFFHDSSGASRALTGSGSSEIPPGSRILGLNDSSHVLFADFQGEGLSLFDLATNAVSLLPPLPGSNFVNQWGSVVTPKVGKAVINNAGDVLLSSYTDGLGSSLWIHKQGLGWLDVSAATGLISFYDPSLAVQEIGLTDDGLIFGSYTVNGTGMTAFKTSAPVPEPTSLILLALGAGGLIAARRRKRN